MICKKCNKDKPDYEFLSRRNSTVKLAKWCDSCRGYNLDKETQRYRFENGIELECDFESYKKLNALWKPTCRN